MPFFSIVMPTRNRAHQLVNSALKSVLQQDFEDFEVIICDNASTDNTQILVKDINDTRVSYIYSSPWMPKEKFFEFSLKHAKGKYLLLFFDDDVLMFNALSKCHKVLNSFGADILTFPNSIIYHSSDWHRSKERNMLTVSPYMDEVYIKDAKAHLQKIFAARILIPGTPYVTNAFYKTSFIQGLVKYYGTLFPHGHMGDYNIACYALANTEHFLYVDSPVMIFSLWSENTPQQIHDLKTTMPEYQEWVAWATENLLANMPFKSYLFSNCIVATLLDMKKRLGLPWEIDWAGYFDDIRSDIIRLKRLGVNVSQLQEEYDSAIRNQPSVNKPEDLLHVFGIEKSLVGKLGLKFEGEHNNFSDILSAREFLACLQKYGAKVDFQQQKKLYIVLQLGKLLGKLTRLVLGQRGYQLVLKYVGHLGRLIGSVAGR